MRRRGRRRSRRGVAIIGALWNLSHATTLCYCRMYLYIHLSAYVYVYTIYMYAYTFSILLNDNLWHGEWEKWVGCGNNILIYYYFVFIYTLHLHYIWCELSRHSVAPYSKIFSFFFIIILRFFLLLHIWWWYYLRFSTYLPLFYFFIFLISVVLFPFLFTSHLFLPVLFYLECNFGSIDLFFINNEISWNI